jgi:hypothetical protein
MLFNFALEYDVANNHQGRQEVLTWNGAYQLYMYTSDVNLLFEDMKTTINEDTDRLFLCLATRMRYKIII